MNSTPTARVLSFVLAQLPNTWHRCCRFCSRFRLPQMRACVSVRQEVSTVAIPPCAAVLIRLIILVLMGLFFASPSLLVTPIGSISVTGPNEYFDNFHLLMPRCFVIVVRTDPAKR